MAAIHSSSSKSPVSTMEIFTVSRYSWTSRTPTGQALKSKPFDFHARSWRIKVYPTGIDHASTDFVSIFLKCRTEPFHRFDATITMEITDKTSPPPRRAWLRPTTGAARATPCPPGGASWRSRSAWTTTGTPSGLPCRSSAPSRRNRRPFTCCRGCSRRITSRAAAGYRRRRRRRVLRHWQRRLAARRRRW
jgi:hypothetical protein